MCDVVADDCADEDCVALVLPLYVGPWAVLEAVLELLCDGLGSSRSVLGTCVVCSAGAGLLSYCAVLSGAVGPLGDVRGMESSVIDSFRSALMVADCTFARYSAAMRSATEAMQAFR